MYLKQTIIENTLKNYSRKIYFTTLIIFCMHQSVHQLELLKWKMRCKTLFQGQDFSQGEGQDLNFILRGHSRLTTSCNDYNTGWKCKNRRKLIYIYFHFLFINLSDLCRCSRWPDTFASVVTPSPRWGVSRTSEGEKYFSGRSFPLRR